MSTAVGRHSHGYFRQAEPVGPVKTRSGLLRRLLPWGPTAQTPASSLLAAPVAVAEEAENQQREGEPQLSGTTDAGGTTADAAIEEWAASFGGNSDLGHLEGWGPYPPASQAVPGIHHETPVDETYADSDLTGGPRPFAPQQGEATDPEPPTWLRALDRHGNLAGKDVELLGGPLFTGVVPTDDGGFLAELDLGWCLDGSFPLAAAPKYLRALAAAALAAADAHDSASGVAAEPEPAEPEAEAVAETSIEEGGTAAEVAADEPAEAAPVLAEVPGTPAEPVTDDETTPVADDAVQTEVTDGDLAAVSDGGSE